MATHITQPVPTVLRCSKGDMTAKDLRALVDRLCQRTPQQDDVYRAQVALLHLANLMRGELDRQSEPSCAHSYLPGGMGCIQCESDAFEAKHRGGK